MKIKNVDDNALTKKGLTMTLECETQEKEETSKRVRENSRECRSVFGNVELKCGK